MQSIQRLLSTHGMDLRHRTASSRRYSRYAEPILQFFALHRIALSDHVERHFKCYFKTNRSTRMHLQTLVAAGDLKIDRQPSLGQPNVYSITTRGLNRAREGATASIGEVAGRQMSRRSHLPHELLITEFGVSVAEEIRERPDLRLLWEDRFGLTRYAELAELVPDFVFLFRSAKGMLACLVEVSSGEESPTRIREKLQKYSGWSRTVGCQSFLSNLYRSHGAHVPRPEFRLLFVVHNRASNNDLVRLRQIVNEAMNFSDDILPRFWGTTVKEIASANGIDDPIWVCGNEFKPVLPQWNGAVPKRRKLIIQRLLEKLPRHRLFPSAGHPS